jgi:hypothetical protein
MALHGVIPNTGTLQLVVCAGARDPVEYLYNIVVQMNYAATAWAAITVAAR